ncbi:hypothetical protein, partial [Saccharopolyspora shandongensis]|uniref:hypothetical protein n=1 Tax=Saccharopolyspora shandongensis TaxID=418495 RepID=UPI00115FF3E0
MTAVDSSNRLTDPGKPQRKAITLSRDRVERSEVGKQSQSTLDNLLTEERGHPQSEEFAAQANATSALYEEASADREAFWA